MSTNDVLAIDPDNVFFSEEDLSNAIQLIDAGEEVGRFYITDGRLCFEGDMDRTAKALFEILKPMMEQYIAARLREAMG